MNKWMVKGNQLTDYIGKRMRSCEGMELVQVAILIAIAVGLGIIFKNEITSFVNQTFESLDASKF